MCAKLEKKEGNGPFFTYDRDKKPEMEHAQLNRGNEDDPVGKAHL